MRSNYLKATLKAAILAVTVLLLMAEVSSAQTVNLTASQQTTTLSDGNTVPMWGWTCGTGTAAATGATCTALTYGLAGTLNPQTGGAVWQPPLIVVPSVATTGASLTINLTNSLPVETSIVIIGQASATTTAANGGLGVPVREAGPRTDGAHGGQTATTWFIVAGGSFTPPAQGERVRSFVAEVAGVATVGAAPTTLGYSWTGLKPGTYLIRTGTYPSIQGPMGLYGVLVVTTAPVAGTSAGIAYPPASPAAGAVTYDSDVVALESEIDARQNNMVAALFPSVPGGPSANPGFNETLKWTPQCGAGPNGLTSTGTAPTCYPPAVDYTPKYFLINGLAFSKDNQQASALSIPGAGTTGNVLVRYVNAGSHMHVPTVNGLNMLLVAEDGYVLPDVALALSNGKTLFAKNPNQTAPATAASGLRVQNEVFQAAGKVFDVIVSPTQTTAGTYDTKTYATFDRSLALSTNSQRDGGMQAVLDVNDAGAAALIAANSVAVARPDIYAYAPGVTLKVSDPGKGVIANDSNVYGVQVSTLPTAGTLTLYPNGTFTYAPSGGAADSFGYCANGTTLTSAVPICTTVALNVSATANAANAPTANPDSYASKTVSLLRVGTPGVLQNDTDPNSYPLTAVNAVPSANLNVQLNPDGSFTARPTGAGSATCPAGTPTGSNCFTFTYQAKNSQNILSAPATATTGGIVTLAFLSGSGLVVNVQDAQTKAPITDYKWIIEQDLTLPINPACQQNGSGGAKPANCPAGVPPTPATQFHASYYPVIAEGCTGPQSCERGQTAYDAGTPCTSPGVPAGCSATAGQHVLAACDGYGICTVGATQLPASFPSDAHLTATNPDGSPATYYISILPGDSTNAFAYGNSSDPSVAGNCTPDPTAPEPTGIVEASTCSHVMGGSQVPAGTCTGTPGTASYSCVYSASSPVTVNLQIAPIKTATVTAFVFEDDFPLNGEPDTGGGVDVLATQEKPLGDFQIILWDTAGGIGDFTGQMHHDMFNMPLTNALNGTIDPSTGLDACPISNTGGVAVGVIIVCPQFESDGVTPSPLTGQVVVKNLMQGKYSIIAHPGAIREANGEEWLQTNTLDGGHFLDSFIRSGEPPYFQEFGPGGYHVFIGFANPAHINARLAAICAGQTDPLIPFALPCRNHLNGQVTNLHQGRSPSEQLFGGNVFPFGDPGNYAALNYTTCYAALGDSDGATIALSKCDADGNFSFDGIAGTPGLPDGNYGIVIFDQWDDLIVDGSSHAVNLTGGQTMNVTYPSFTWQTHLWTRAYMDTGGLGRPVLASDGSLDPIASPGLIQIPIRIRQRNGKFVNTSLTNIGGVAHFDEAFPLFAFYTVESDDTRFRNTGVHVVNDSGGRVDGPTAGGGNGRTGTALNPNPYQGILNSTDTFPLPGPLQVPGAYYCSSADCTDKITAFTAGGGSGGSTGRIDPGSVVVEGWQGGVSQFDMIDWGKIPYISGENGGIRGHVVNGTTRPFDDPRMLFQNLWEPLVPNVTVNLYQETTAPDGTMGLTLVDTTLTSSWDSWAQGFRADGVTPNMSCTGQDPVNDPFFTYTMAGTRNYLNPGTPLPNNSQYKCYDGYHNLNQLQPAPYDGLYQFPSQTCLTAGATFTIAGNSTVYHCATVANPAAGQPGAATAILPPAKYVTEMVLPAGWELSKEEDLNLLIGDQYIAPVTQQFAGLGSIFIVPDQAAIDSINPSYTGPYTAANPYNPPFTCTTPTSCTFTPTTTNNGKPSTDLGRTSFGSFGPGGLIQQSAPCVGLMRIVPDYLSIAPEVGEIAPFAGSLRPLCDRKEVSLDDQMQANADFFIYTKTPKATTFTGFISDDFASEFDPASPSFGEKFAIPNVPVSIKDFSGNEISRIYSDQWGTFNGLVYSTWEVDPPNPTGYAPNMMITCMNDPGPIPDPLHPGQFITDPFYNPAYSDFCYENPFMPGDAAYLDTPVIPVSAFAEGYNPPDCAYPDATPMIKSVTGDTSGGGAGPWVSGTGPAHRITITSLSNLSNQVVPNNAYSGPAANTTPFNQKFATRHYGFGTTAGTVSITGPNGAPVALGGVTWGDATISAFVPAGVCPPPQMASGCKGQLVITAANGRQSIDTVTVTVGGTPPTYVAGENATNNAIQTAIDNAAPGDLIIVGPGTYNELLLMWKPVRLQGVGDGAVIVNANAHPAGKLEPWRRQVNCLFGLALNGGVSTGNNTGGPAAGGPGTGGGTNPYDPNYDGTPGSGFVCPSSMQGQVDRIPGQGIIGWDATLNGNLAELLQEPTLMGAYEGAAITVLGKGVTGLAPGVSGAEGTFGPGVVPLNGTTNCSTTDPNYFVGNFLCAPSRIDGITFTNSSQGGGGIYLHGWNHNMEVSNNHVTGNGGTLTGGITVGQPETLDATLVGTIAQAFNYDINVDVHNNSVTLNASYGDELNSNTPASAGGVTFCTGSDYYKFQFNWVCGNLSTGDGGGFAHLGFIYNGDIEHNWFVFNQSINPTLTTSGGGAIIHGAPVDQSVIGGVVTECGSVTDVDCAPGLSDGVGPGLVINANLFQGNTAEEGNGGGLMLMHVNGNDVLNNPSNPANWYTVNVTNNVFVNNVAGWAGGGVSLLDAVLVNFSHNTVASNDSTSSAGVEFGSLGAPQANQPPPGCDPTNNPTCAGFQIATSNHLPAGLETEHHSANLSRAFTNPSVTCPAGHPQCTTFSNPVLDHNIFWQNRSFYITAPANSPVIVNPSLQQASTGACPASTPVTGLQSGGTYWDIGVYNDSSPTTAAAGNPRLHPTNSTLSSGGYGGNGNNPTPPGFTHQYCNGPRVPPEIATVLCGGPNGNANAPGCIQPGAVGLTTNPGVPDSLVPPLPIFTLTPAATVDEGSNWINMFYGPLSLFNSVTYTGTTVAGPTPLGNYNHTSSAQGNTAGAPTYNPRP